MKTEFEVKVLDKDFEAVRKNLARLGGERVHTRRLMKRYILDFADTSMQNANAYVRVRDEGDRITTTFKQTESREIDGVKELETEVSDLDAMLGIYEKIGLQVHSYQETYRESWSLGECAIELDEWPWLDPFIEIEGRNERAVRETVGTLGYAWDEVVPGDVVQLYQDIFEIEDWEIARKAEIKFGPIPDWLEAKRK